jgi:uncharacterized protein YoxC
MKPSPNERASSYNLYRNRRIFVSLEIKHVKKFVDELRKHLKGIKPQFQEIISPSKTFTKQAETL